VVYLRYAAPAGAKICNIVLRLTHEKAIPLKLRQELRVYSKY
jgi:hypothetical protein